MKPLPHSPELLHVARRMVWFKEPEAALADPRHFLAYVMTYGMPQDVSEVRRVVGMEGFREVLENAPPGVFDRRSWAYWNLVCGLDPDRPLPVRRFPE